MKKFTLFIALLVCAAGFSQRTTTSVSSMGENSPVYAQRQNVAVPTEAAQETQAAFLAENNPIFAQQQQIVLTAPASNSTSNLPTSFVSDEVRGTNVNYGPAGTASNATRGVDVIITHSNTQTIEAGAEIACASGTSFRNNSIYRDFDLAGDFGIAGDFNVTTAEIAIGVGVITPGGFPLTVNVYSIATGTFPGGALTLQGTTGTTVFESDAETILSLPVAATIPAGESLIYEVVIVDDGTDTNYMRFGANNDGQTGPSYIMAVDCGAATPTDLATLGLNNSFVMNIIGDEAGGGGGCSQSNPSFAFENGRGFNAGNGWTVANDVIVPMGEDMMLNQLTVYAFNNPGATITSADISIWDDAAGLPGAMISSETLAPTSETFVGTNFGFDIDALVFDITPAALAGDAGTDVTYWVAIQVTCSDGGPAYWENSTDTAIGNPLAFDDTGGWQIPDATQDGVYIFSADCTPIGGGGGCTVEEDFDAGLPAGWSTVINTGNCDWHNGMILPTGDPFTTNAMIFNDDDACGEGSGAPASNVTLLSDVYDTNGATSVMLGYDAAFQEAGEGGSLTVEVFDGAAWQQVAFYDADLDPDIQAFSLDVTAHANADFAARWTYDDGGGWGWHAGVDNFCLTHDGGVVVGPPNDECVDAIAVACGDTVVGETITATDSGENSAGDVWYSFTGTGSAEMVTLSLCDGGTDYDSLLRVYDSCGGAEITSNDDFCGLQSELEFTSDGTSTYYIMVEGFGSNVGNFSLAVTCVPIQGTSDNEIEGFSYYPNPANNVINLNAQDNIERVSIYNILGQKVVDQNINATSTQLDVANLTTGTYLMEVSVDGKSATYKIVKN